MRPTFDSNIKKLEVEFAHGYQVGTNVFFIFVCKEREKTAEMTDEELDHWRPLWREKNELFEARLKANPHLSHLLGSRFFVRDGNHRF
jgi:hypothetical protein